MRYIKRIPIEDEVKSKNLLDAGWNPMVAPWGRMLHGIALVGIAMLLITMNGLYLWLLTEQRGFVGWHVISAIDFARDMGILLIAALITLLLHEGIHALCIPSVFSSEITYWGFHGIFGYVYTEEKMTRGRYLLVSVMPLLVISYLVPAVLALGNQLQGSLCILSLLNAGGACSDILNVIYVYKQVSSRGEIISNGDVSFYKENQ